MPQRGRAQLYPLGRAGGPGGADDDRRTFGDSLVVGRTDRGDTLGVLDRARAEGGDYLGQPPGRQPGVKRQDRGSGAVERRRQQLDQSGVARLTRTARNGRIVTIVKVRSLTLGGYA